MNSGIYKIVNLINNKIYIGSSINLNKRKKEHFRALKGNYHINKHLQSSYNKYGKENFIFEIIEYIKDKNKLIEKEQEWFNKLNINFKNSYNICFVAGNTLGRKHTEEAKSKMSEFWKGKNIGKNNPFYGKQHTKEVKEKMSERQIGEKSKWYGKHLPKETRDKIGLKSQGEGNGMAILSEQQVIEIKILLFKKQLKQKEIAKLFNISSQRVSNIKKGKSWSYIKLEDYINKNENENLLGVGQ